MKPRRKLSFLRSGPSGYATQETRPGRLQVLGHPEQSSEILHQKHKPILPIKPCRLPAVNTVPSELVCLFSLIKQEYYRNPLHGHGDTGGNVFLGSLPWWLQNPKFCLWLAWTVSVVYKSVDIILVHYTLRNWLPWTPWML